ncbi:MAG TPA: transposase [Anaeromyxobacter sp.]|nr:transposase [Anaeromyxobacter sp.]
MPLGFCSQERVLARLRRLARTATTAEPVFFEDEMDVHLNPKIGRDWMPRGHRRYVLTPGQNKKRFVAGSERGDRETHLGGCANQGERALPQARLEAPRRAPRHLILDNYIIRSSKKTQRFLAQFGGRVVLHFLPPYLCPDDNRIERVWLDLHTNAQSPLPDDGGADGPSRRLPARIRRGSSTLHSSSRPVFPEIV